MVGASSGALDLGMGRGHIYFNSIVEEKMCRGAKLVETFLCCLRDEGFVRHGEAMESQDRRAESCDKFLR